jgi:two-component system phosphate regulon sensor histidine kinase PhoR
VKQNYILTIIGISALGLILLTAFQVNWILEGKRLREGHFDHRVSLALCHAVGQLEENPLSCMPGAGTTCAPAQKPEGKICGTFLTSMPDEAVLLDILEKAIARYDLPKTFEYKLEQKAPLPTLGTWAGQPSRSYSCEVGNTSNIQLKLFFPEKTRIILGQMGFMLVSSFILILFISLCFVLTILTAWKHKRIAAQNVEFFNHLAHEFRTPLSNIKLASNMLTKKLKSTAESQETRFLKVIREENHRLIEQVDQVLDFARMERGEQPLTFEQVDLMQSLHQAIECVRLSIQSREGELHVDVSPYLPPVTGDAFHLKQVFVNLLDNAVKYSPDPPLIEVKAFDKGKHVCISVEDHGIGMNPEQLKLIFKQYVRLQGQHAQANRGFGLGLPYARMVIEAHGGYIQVSSKQGEGSIFSVFLPKQSPSQK